MRRRTLSAFSSLALALLIPAFGVVQASHFHAMADGGERSLSPIEETLKPVEAGSFCLICTLAAGFTATPIAGVPRHSLTPAGPCCPLQDGDLDSSTLLTHLLRGPPASSRIS